VRGLSIEREHRRNNAKKTEIYASFKGFFFIFLIRTCAKKIKKKKKKKIFVPAEENAKHHMVSQCVNEQ
jgi:hypothetical protein